VSLILVRHGQTVMNRGGRFQGRADSPLTELGEMQADLVATALAERGATHVVTSPLLRARQTAERIAAHLGLDVTADDRLIEIDYGTWDGASLSSVSAEEWARWRAEPTFTPPGGESLVTVWDRAIACADELLGRGGTTIAVSHVSPIKAIVAWSVGADASASWRMHLDVAAVCRVGGVPDAPVLRTFNATLPTLG
jgi:broad specificity phosphatase PhoE